MIKNSDLDFIIRKDFNILSDYFKDIIIDH